MKFRAKLLITVLTLLLVVVCAVACTGGGAGDDTTAPAATTTAAGTSSAVTTTAPVSGNATVTTAVTTTVTSPPGSTTLSTAGQDKLKFDDKTVVYNGNSQNISVTGLSHTPYLTATYDLGRQTEVGTYTVTVTFSFKKEEYAASYVLPAPMTATLTITKATASIGTFPAATEFYFPGCEYDLVLDGTMPKGLTVEYSMTKVKDADGNDVNVPVAAGKATEAGVYDVTATFIDANNNYEPITPLTTQLTVKQSDKQVLKYTAQIDGKLDAAYLSSASYETAYYKDDDSVDPTENCILRVVIDNVKDTSYVMPSATVYMLWDGDYIYACSVVYDPTDNFRSNDYCNWANPWINDGFEFYYFFGGYAQPIIPESADTYPTYKTISIDSYARVKTAIELQRSYFYNQVEVVGTQTPDGQGGVTYTLEYKFPAIGETFDGIGTEITKTPNEEKIKAGEFAYIAIQINDLATWPQEGGVDVPDVNPEGAKYDPYPTMTAEWAAFEATFQAGMIVANNRNKAYMNEFLVFQFSDEAFASEVDITLDGERDENYDSFGTDTTMAQEAVNVSDGETVTSSINNTATGSIVWDGQYIYVYAAVLDDIIKEYVAANGEKNDILEIYLKIGETYFMIHVAPDGTVIEGSDLVADSVVSTTLTGGYAVELKIAATDTLKADGVALTAGTVVSFSICNYDLDAEDIDTAMYIGAYTEVTDYSLISIIPSVPTEE